MCFFHAPFAPDGTNAKKGIGMNVKQENTISMEQLRKLLHISGCKASWMLRNGVIPCENRGCATHTFVIRMEDVEAYLAKPRRQRKKEIPVGGFNAKPIHIELHPEYCLKLRGAKRERFIEFLEETMFDVPDALTIDEAATVIGYHRQTVYNHTAKGDITAIRISGKYIIPKSELIQYLVTDRAFRIQRKSEWHMEVIGEFLTEEADR